MQFEAVPVSDGFRDLFTFNICLAIILLSMLFAFYRKESKQIAQGLFVEKTGPQIIREGSLFRSRIRLLWFPYVVVVQALLLLYLFRFFCPHWLPRLPMIVWMLLSVGAVLVDFLVKNLLRKFYAYLFDYDKNETMEMQLQKYFCLTDLTVILLPILILSTYMECPVLLFAYAFAFFVVFAVMFGRLLVLSAKRRNSFQFFLYFCTIEILPYIIVLKTVTILAK